MSTTSITHRPTSFVAAGAAVLAIAAGAVALSVSDNPAKTTAPAGHISQTSVQPTHPHGRFHYTGSGGHVLTDIAG
jgi:hypothetical protein